MSVRMLAAAVSGRGVVDPDEAVVACDDEGFARGRAAFETLRVYDGTPFRLAEHVDRLAQSAARLGLPGAGRRGRARGRGSRAGRGREPRRRCGPPPLLDAGRAGS